jgi:hypothetical protein
VSKVQALCRWTPFDRLRAAVMLNLSVWARPPIAILKQVQGDEAVAVESRWEGRRPYINRSPEQQARSACDRRRVSKVQALRRWTPFDRLRAAVMM